jgi:predicted AAA+ superfamily ATPase
MMEEPQDALLRRIADALDRLAPAPIAAADPDRHPAYVWRHGGLRVAEGFAPLPLAMLTGIDGQKNILHDNTKRLAVGHAAHDALLWGSRGMGKSALVKAVTGDLQQNGAALSLIEIAGDSLDSLPELFRVIAGRARRYVLFLDDVGFDEQSAAPRLLRSMLEGGAEARPDNARLYVTANRRNIVHRDMREQDDPINMRDVVDDRLALADRFGLSLGFHACDQDHYVAMVRTYADRLGLTFDPLDAIQWATQRGSRSGRIAWHFVQELAARSGRSVVL